jgi:hypothetical protein
LKLPSKHLAFALVSKNGSYQTVSRDNVFRALEDLRGGQNFGQFDLLSAHIDSSRNRQQKTFDNGIA